MSAYATNKKARFDYDILDTIEAGLVLTGQEVKSVRAGQAKLAGGFITFHNDAAWLTNIHIPKYKHASALPDYRSDHSRKLLLRKKQIDYLRGKTQEKGLTIVPLSLYTKGPLIKVEIGLARGKKRYDKRLVLRERELKREMAKKMKWG